MTTVLYAHPYSGSFNHAILEEVVSVLKEQNRDHSVIDLYADGFNPALEAASLRLYSHGESADPLVKKYIQALMDADRVIMIFPIWWGMMPAIVKGFFDKVMLTGTAYRYTDDGQLVPDKINVPKTLIFTTSQSDTENFSQFFGEYFKTHILDAVGLLNAEWYNCDKTAHGPAENRDRFLSLVREKM